jgi:alpha-beta hydrolase superfamily lysophospholipase
VNTSADAPTIVLIHGLFVTPLSWENWIERYSAQGYDVIAPAWPGMEGEVERLRADTPAFENLGVAEVVHHYDGIIRGLDAPPIIMGHSFGGAGHPALARSRTGRGGRGDRHGARQGHLHASALGAAGGQTSR